MTHDQEIQNAVDEMFAQAFHEATTKALDLLIDDIHQGFREIAEFLESVEHA